jgi:hypothetical protein
MMGMRMPETCRAVSKRQAINLRNCCIWLVDSFECMMMYGLANPKFRALSIGLLLPTSTKPDLNTPPTSLPGFFPPCSRVRGSFPEDKVTRE